LRDPSFKKRTKKSHKIYSEFRNLTVGSPIKIEIMSQATFQACCCTITSLYFKFPDCIGCESKGNCLCIHHDAMCCKTAKDGKNWCICQEAKCYLGPSSTLIKSVAQTGCCMNSCAFPCDSDVPCAVGACFCILCVNFAWSPGFCKTVGHAPKSVSP
jgi:hypothetical protein